MALTIEEINKIVSKFAYKTKSHKDAEGKASIDFISKNRVGVTKYPEYWDGYNFAANLYDSILPHTRSDVYPSHLLSVRAPNQTQMQADYIKANYKAVTLNVFEDFKATISRAFADQNWSLKYNSETDERFGQDNFQRFVNNEIDKYGSLEAFVKSLLPTLKLVDPNGIIAIEPEDFDVERKDDDSETILLSNNLIKPLPNYYNCKRIVGQDLDKYYLVVDDDNSMVKNGSKYEETGIVLELYDDAAIYRIEQIGRKSDFTFGDPVVYFQHDLGYVPCKKLMGTPQIINNELLFQSPFSTVVPLLDQVVLDESYLQMSKATSAFPFMVAIGEICEFTDREGNRCDNGQIFDTISGGYRTCGGCGGAGVKSRFSPTGMLLVKPKTSLSDGDTGISGEYMKFVSPPMDTLTFLRTEIDSHLKKSREILHLPSSDSSITIGESSTATGSLNKMRSLYAFVKPISDQLFSIYEFCLITMGKMRYGEYFGGVTLVYPTSFDISTPSDYLALISEGIKAGVPPAVTYANVYNYIKAVNYTDDESSAIYELIVNADELLLMSSADVIARISNGTVEKWQDVLHHSAPQLIMELMREYIPTELNPTFVSLPMQDQINLLKEKAVSKVREVLDPIQQAQQNILNGIA